MTTSDRRGKTARLAATLAAIASLAAVASMAVPGSDGAGAPGGEAITAAQALERFEALAGRWAGTNSRGQRVTLEYEIVANGTAVLERLDMHAPDEQVHDMLTVYHLDGDRLMLTHYCAAGNQPRMRATELRADVVAFDFIDGTSLESDSTGHMHRAEFDFSRPGRLVSRWTWRENGEDRHIESIDIERVDARPAAARAAGVH